MCNSNCSVFLNCQGTQIQSQKTQGFCVADFATLSDELRSCSKIFSLFIWIKEPCVRKFEGLEPSNLLGISQTEFIESKEGESDWLTYIKLRRFKPVSADNLNCW